MWVVAIGGIIAVCTRNFVNLGPSTDNIGLDMGLVIGSFAGSVLVSIIAIKAVHWFHCPNHVLTIPSVIPMIPGVLMYRMLFGIINMNVESPEQISILMKAIQSGITSGMVLILYKKTAPAYWNLFPYAGAVFLCYRFIGQDYQLFLYTRSVTHFLLPYTILP